MISQKVYPCIPQFFKWWGIRRYIFLGHVIQLLNSQQSQGNQTSSLKSINKNKNSTDTLSIKAYCEICSCSTRLFYINNNNLQDSTLLLENLASFYQNLASRRHHLFVCCMPLISFQVVLQNFLKKDITKTCPCNIQRSFRL